MRARRFKLIVAWIGIIVLISFAGYREFENAVTRLNKVTTTREPT